MCEQAQNTYGLRLTCFHNGSYQSVSQSFPLQNACWEQQAVGGDMAVQDLHVHCIAKTLKLVVWKQNQINIPPSLAQTPFRTLTEIVNVNKHRRQDNAAVMYTAQKHMK